jgi:hypothetical protein
MCIFLHRCCNFHYNKDLIKNSFCVQVRHHLVHFTQNVFHLLYGMLNLELLQLAPHFLVELRVASWIPRELKSFGS